MIETLKPTTQVGAFIQQCCVEAGINVRQLLSGDRKWTWQYWSISKGRNFISKETFEKVCNALDLSPSEVDEFLVCISKDYLKYYGFTK